MTTVTSAVSNTKKIKTNSCQTNPLVLVIFCKSDEMFEKGKHQEYIIFCKEGQTQTEKQNKFHQQYTRPMAIILILSTWKIKSLRMTSSAHNELRHSEAFTILAMFLKKKIEFIAKYILTTRSL